MPSRSRTSWRASWAISGVCAVLAAVAALDSPAPAHAGRIASARAEATAAQAQLNALYAKSDQAVQAYDKAVSQLHAVRVAIAHNKQQLGIARRNLAAARARLGALVVSTYKGSNTNLDFYVLGAHSFNDLVNRIDFVNRMSQTESDILGQVRRAERDVARREAVLEHQRGVAAKLVQTRAAERRRVMQLVAGQRQLVANLNARVRHLIDARAAHLAAIARAKAAAARRAARIASSPTRISPQPPAHGGGGAPPPANSLGGRAVQIAETQLGVPYVWGGASPSGFDCSGLTMWVYAQLGIHLDHYTGSQWNAGPHVPYDQLAPGDLVFFEPGIGHVGIYIGGGSFIHAPHTGDVVRISSLSEAWYASEYQGAVRVTG
jgi:peptidoglycan DL-endopeptidase CwlO